MAGILEAVSEKTKDKRVNTESWEEAQEGTLKNTLFPLELKLDGQYRDTDLKLVTVFIIRHFLKKYTSFRVLSLLV
jgi:hypothetical protein